MRPFVGNYDNAKEAKAKRKELCGFIVFNLRNTGPSDYIVCSDLHETAVWLGYYGGATYGEAAKWIERNYEYIREEGYIIRVCVFKLDVAIADCLAREIEAARGVHGSQNRWEPPDFAEYSLLSEADY